MRTFTSAISEKPSQFAIKSDRWDRVWYEETITAVERLAELTEHLGQVHEAGPDAMADLFMVLSKGAPDIDDNLRPDRAVNRMIAEQVKDSDGVRDVRRFSVGSQVQSALGCITFAPYLEALYADEDVEEAQEKAEAAQAAHDALDALMGKGSSGGEDDEAEEQGEGPGEDEIADAMGAVEAADGELEDALDRIAARVGQVCRKAANEAGDAANQRGDAMGIWGTTPGEWDRMDPDEFIERAEQIDSPHFREVAKVLGKMENLRIGVHREKVDGVPTEVWSVELGNDLGRLLPSEYLGLVDDDFSDDFFRRYAGRQLMQYQLRSIEHTAAGGIILIEDGSGSMDGEPHRWAKGFGLALGSIARDEDRAFHALEFGWRGEHKHHPFPDRKSWTAKARLDYAGSFLNGSGTDFETPLDWAVSLLGEEFEATGRVSGDVVMITDGECNVGDEWLEHFLSEKERLGFKVYALLVGRNDEEEVMSKFSDYIGTITTFTDGTDVRDVFKAVA